MNKLSAADFKDYLLKAVRDVFNSLGPKDELAPVAFILTETLNVAPVSSFFVDDRGKDALVKALAGIASTSGVQGIALVHEAWVAEEIINQEVGLDQLFARPSERSDRREAVLLRVETRDGVEFWMARIEKNNGSRTMSAWETSKGAGGRMAQPFFADSKDFN